MRQTRWALVGAALLAGLALGRPLGRAGHAPPTPRPRRAPLATAIRRTGPPAPTVYLTIDDGPNPVGTPKVLQILRQYHVRVTFFVIGMHAAAYPNLLRAMYREGNAIGDHTWDHDYALCYRSPEAALADFNHAADVIQKILGFRPHIARAPGGTWGNFTPETFRLLHQAGYRIYNWNVSVGDSSLSPVPPAVELARVEAETRGTGPYIVLMHDDHPNTVAALPAIIRYFKARGFRFGLLTDPDVPRSLEAVWIPFKYAPWVGGVGTTGKE